MKKHLFTILLLFSMLSMQVGIAAAAPLASGTATLISAENGDKGPVFTFSVSGKFSRASLNGSAQVLGGAEYDLYCKQVDDDTVTCTTSKKVSGVNVALSWGGFIFWTYVPEAPTHYCYNVYDYNLDFTWQSYGTFCQDTPALYGSQIPWYNPDYDDEYDAVFMPAGPSCSGIDEDAYYYPWCNYAE